MVGMTKILKGRTLSFTGDPFKAPWQDVTTYEPSGAIVIEGGKIVSVGPDDRELPAGEVIDYGDKLILAGFVDAHVHYPQTAIVASWGKRLIDWLNGYTFPEEAKFSDPDYASEIAGRYLDLVLSHGTTTVCSYGTIHPTSVDAIFQQGAVRGMQVLAGKTCMDRNAPDNLQDTALTAYDESKNLLETWHGQGRASYVITPRFSPTSSREQLEALGALWAEHPECLMQTHISEQVEEIAWVRELFPTARDYLDTYEAHGLLGARGVYGHAIHLEAREEDRLREVGAGLVHCPTSNTFIGSGLFAMARHKAGGQRVGLATDTGGGSSFSMLRTMASCYEISQLQGEALHPAQLIWLATLGSAQVLHLSDRIGNIAPGLAADLVVLDLASTPAIAQRTTGAEDIWDAAFPTIMMGDDRAVVYVYVGGERVVAP